MTIHPRRLAPLWCATLALLTNPAIAAESPPFHPATKNAGPGLVSPDVPTDLPSGAAKADLNEAATFAWQEFIGLNWPALRRPGKVDRGTPDTGAKFGQPGTTPLVWESMRQKAEIFPGNNSADSPPHGVKLVGGNPVAPYNYGERPQYQYSRDVPACPGQPTALSAPYINLDESSQIELDQMYAGIVDDPTPHPKNNSAPQLIRFLAKANQKEYDYVVAHKLWYNDRNDPTSPLQARIGVWTDALRKGTPPDPNAVVTLPPGSIEVKAAWRPLAASEDPSRFHMATVRYYETGLDGNPCYWQAKWALVALHIIQKTPSAPYFTFATFEQADNLLLADGDTVENDEGFPTPAGRNPPTAESQPTTPILAYQDNPISPQVTAVGGVYCGDPGRRLYFHELPPGTSPPPPGTPVDGNICVNKRYEAIPLPIREANQAFHLAIKVYSDQNNVKDSPWLHYKLVNVQYRPFDRADINAQNGRSTFFQANSVVETDYTLQQFIGRIASNQAPTSLYLPNGKPQAFQNVHVAKDGHLTPYQMGGCMGCHGNAQVGGTDFSFLVGGNRFNTKPDVPTPDHEKQALYLALFGNPPRAK